MAPAYDLTFSVDLEALPFENYHTFSVNSKVSGVTDMDMLEVAEKYDLKKADAKRTIDVVRTVMGTFPEIAERNEVLATWIDRIAAYLNNQ